MAIRCIVVIRDGLSFFVWREKELTSAMIFTYMTNDVFFSNRLLSLFPPLFHTKTTTTTTTTNLPVLFSSVLASALVIPCGVSSRSAAEMLFGNCYIVTHAARESRGRTAHSGTEPVRLAPPLAIPAEKGWKRGLKRSGAGPMNYRMLWGWME